MLATMLNGTKGCTVCDVTCCAIWYGPLVWKDYTVSPLQSASLLLIGYRKAEDETVTFVRNFPALLFSVG